MSQPTNPADRLAAIAQRADNATKGPWFTGLHYKSDVHSREGGVIRANCWNRPQAIADAEFIAHAREDIPWLLAELRTLQQERESWKVMADSMRVRWEHAEAQLAALTAEREPEQAYTEPSKT